MTIMNYLPFQFKKTILYKKLSLGILEYNIFSQ